MIITIILINITTITISSPGLHRHQALRRRREPRLLRGAPLLEFPLNVREREMYIHMYRYVNVYIYIYIHIQCVHANRCRLWHVQTRNDNMDAIT